MKLLRLSPEQLMQNWPYVRECILLALPPYVTSNVDNIIRIQEQLLIGTLECWACIEDATGLFYGIVTTQVVVDEATRTKNLFLFSVTLTEEHENKIWQEGYMYLSRYAASKGCNSIIAYTNQEEFSAFSASREQLENISRASKNQLEMLARSSSC